jgi:hypothetical protein
MSEIVMTTDVEVEDFTDDLSDEALDRAEGAAGRGGSYCASGGGCSY